jgi:hypothetical protein
LLQLSNLYVGSIELSLDTSMRSSKELCRRGVVYGMAFVMIVVVVDERERRNWFASLGLSAEPAEDESTPATAGQQAV